MEKGDSMGVSLVLGCLTPSWIPGIDYVMCLQVLNGRNICHLYLSYVSSGDAFLVLLIRADAKHPPPLLSCIVGILAIPSLPVNVWPSSTHCLLDWRLSLAVCFIALSSSSFCFPKHKPRAVIRSIFPVVCSGRFSLVGHFVCPGIEATRLSLCRGISYD